MHEDGIRDDCGDSRDEGYELPVVDLSPSCEEGRDFPILLQNVW